MSLNGLLFQLLGLIVSLIPLMVWALFFYKRLYTKD